MAFDHQLLGFPLTPPASGRGPSGWKTHWFDPQISQVKRRGFCCVPQRRKGAASAPISVESA